MTTTGFEGLSAEQAVLLRQSGAALCRKFEGIFGEETIERFLVESMGLLADARVTKWVPVLVERVAADRLRALAKVEERVTVDKPYVVFLCVHNAGRSQMAAGWLRHLAVDGAEVFSGGSKPASDVNPAAVAAMREVGVDIADERPQPWTDEVVQAADVVVTMGCGDACPIFPGKRYEDWEVPDPAGQGVEAVRPIRDDIERRVRELMQDLSIPVVR